MSEEYILDNENNPLGSLTVKEKEVMKEIQSLSQKCMELNIPCFFSAKFSANEDPTAAWHFGRTDQEGLHNFAKDIAPLFLYMTSQVTGTKILVTNPKDGSVVYEIEPKAEESDDNG